MESLAVAGLSTEPLCIHKNDAHPYDDLHGNGGGGIGEAEF